MAGTARMSVAAAAGVSARSANAARAVPSMRSHAAVISAAFHAGLARAVVSLTCRLLDEHGLDITVLSGGVFQNDRLWRNVTELLERRSVRVWWNQRVPPNDGGLSLGQAALAALANP